MELLNQFIQIENTMIRIANYSLSYVEFIGTLFGLISVWLATKANWHTWTTGIVNVIAFFIIYYQIQLYSDMLLQVFFFGCSLVGIYKWLVKDKLKNNKSIRRLSRKKLFLCILSICFTSALVGYYISRIHIYAPTYFSEAAAFPYLDALTTVLSIFATYLMIHKKIECWYLWITVDIISIGLYYKKGILFISGEYLIFLIMASWGLYQWHKILTNEKSLSIR